MNDLFQSTTPLVAGGPAWFTLPIAIIAGGALLAILILWWGLASALRRGQIRRQMEEYRASLAEEAAAPPRPADHARRRRFPRHRCPWPTSSRSPSPNRWPKTTPEPEPVAAAPEPEPVAEPEPTVEAPAPEPEPVAEAPEPEAAPEPEPEHLEGAPAREPDPAPLEASPNAEAAPVDISPAGFATALAEPAVAAEGETAAEPGPVAEALAFEPEPEAPVAAPDDLTRMKGVGPRLAERLNSVGIASFAQIAALSPGDQEGARFAARRLPGAASTATAGSSRRACSPAATSPVSRRSSASCSSRHPGRSAGIHGAAPAGQEAGAIPSAAQWTPALRPG
ncbi:MAG: hypothetical protein WDN24_05690 [Sphingomonas sp.]